MPTGFLAMPGLVPFPPLGSTAGLGGYNPELYPFPEPPDPFKEGKGTETIIQAQGFAGPGTAIRYPELGSEQEEGTNILASVAPAPRLSGEAPTPAGGEEDGVSVQATVRRGPRVIIRTS
jgi:hypothetical protein